jgi:membrane protease YdiL (CAAX protease family)
MHDEQKRRQTKIAVVFAIVFPTLVTWVYFVLFAGNSAVIGGLSKGIQFAFPVCWVFLWMRMSWAESGLPKPPTDKSVWSTRTNLLVGSGLGIAILLTTIGYYRFAISGSDFDDLVVELESRINKLSMGDPWEFAALGAFYSLVHSFLEEYYFRWFVFGRLRHLTRFLPAAIISALAFMAHHVIVLWVFFGFSFHTVFLSLSIVVGGFLWAWQYERSRSLIGPWVSHLFVDAGIFLVGYHMIFVVLPGLQNG